MPFILFMRMILVALISVPMFADLSSADGSEKIDILIKNLRISPDQPGTVDVAIDHGKILLIGSHLKKTGKTFIDAEGRVALPGLVEPHTHSSEGLLDEVMPNQSGTLEEALAIARTLKTKQTPNELLKRTRKVLDMAVKNGVVAIRDNAAIDSVQGLTTVEVMLQLKKEYQGLLEIQVVAFPQQGIFKSTETNQLMEKAMALGADVVGGSVQNELSWEDSKKHVDFCFQLAKKFHRPVDFHADFSDDLSDKRFTMVEYIAKRTIEENMQGQVSVGHVTSLAFMPEEEAKKILELLALAGVSIVSLPATDLYLGGRGDKVSPTRGLTPIHKLRTAGVNVAFSSNNVRNAFTPFGRFDPLLVGNLLAHIAQLGSPSDQLYVLQMATSNGARAMGMIDQYGIEVGKNADLVILDTKKFSDIISEIPPRSWVIKNGLITVTSISKTQIKGRRAVSK